MIPWSFSRKLWLAFGLDFPWVKTSDEYTVSRLYTFSCGNLLLTRRVLKRVFFLWPGKVSVQIEWCRTDALERPTLHEYLLSSRIWCVLYLHSRIITYSLHTRDYESNYKDDICKIGTKLVVEAVVYFLDRWIPDVRIQILVVVYIAKLLISDLVCLIGLFNVENKVYRNNLQ